MSRSFYREDGHAKKLSVDCIADIIGNKVAESGIKD